MDRTLYGKVTVGDTYRPYELISKQKPLPGYALLADLQTNLSKPQQHTTTEVISTTTYPISKTETLKSPITSHYEQHKNIYQNEDYRVNNISQQQTLQNGYANHNPGKDDAKTPSSPEQNHIYQNEPSNAEKMYRHETREEVRTETRSSGPNPPTATRPTTNNLSELDSLLHDLNTSKNSGILKDRGAVNGARPSVDSLLDELNSVGHTSTIESRTSSTQKDSRFNQPPPAPPASFARKTTASTVSASNATKELDDLMESLSDFKVMLHEMDKPQNASFSVAREVDDQKDAARSAKRPNPSYAVKSAPVVRFKDNLETVYDGHDKSLPPKPTQVDTAYAKPLPKRKSPSPPPAPKPSPPNQLDCMLGTLTSHMTEQGVNTSQKGCCCACDKPIVGQVITALGKTWHPEHFTCTHCQQELGTKNFFEREGKPYCETDYHNLFSPKCAYCSGPILDKCVTALNKTWHPEHFFCAQCGNTFGDEGFHEKNGKPYCKEDYFNMFAPKCGGCNNPIMENYISALNSQWHPECFVCRDCKQSVAKKSFYEVDKKPVCGECLGVSDDDEEGEEEGD